ncbi:MFS transporter [Mycolicibacterium baixiangningiae]|uniref:MFS transporter n=1 Tax=Mycolicibacterium baixiangningiae TaxID=2761578 RepID=UPI0027DA1C6B|nr:MFS transporter [Mycolicibacterium baixiangningiae]
MTADPLTRSRSFLPLMVAAGATVSLTAPLEVLYIREISHSSLYIGIFMLGAAVGVIVVDVFGSRVIPGLDARAALAVGLTLFGIACIGMGLAPGGVPLMSARIVQGFGGGIVLGAGLQAAVRLPHSSADLARSLGRFNVAFLFGGAVASPGGLLVAGLIDGRIGYQVALVGTGVLALLVAAAIALALPRLAAPPGSAPARIGLPRFDRTAGGGAALVLAMSGEFLRGGVLFTALPLAGAARGHSVVTITAAVALMSAVEIVALALAYRLIRRTGVIGMLVGSFTLGTLCSVVLALDPGVTTYLVVSASFGVTLAGATAALPVMVVARVGESAAGLAKFRISAGIGLLAGSVGCAVVGAQFGVPALFTATAVVLLTCAYLAHLVGRHPGLPRPA